MTVTNNVQQPRPRSHWRFWLPLAFQTLILLALPFQAAYTYATGQTVVLQTAPVDPYDLLRGYYVILSYDISRIQTLSELPGWEDIEVQTSPFVVSRDSLFESRDSFYVVLEAPEPSTATAISPPPWQPVRVSRDRPTDLAENQVALRGRYQGWRVTYDLEAYYIPEDQRHEINDLISQVQWSDSEGFVVEVKVNSRGGAVPRSLWVGDRNYRF